jgi:pimeloyl-ACP methyl ester carboxylesterase
MAHPSRPPNAAASDSLPPPKLLLALESRALLEFAAGTVLRRGLQKVAPRGDGHPVLVLPGLGASDVSTRLLRRFLAELGYQAIPWGMGRNRGLRPGMEHQMRARLQALYALHGQKISLIGQSLGGIFARELAKLEPHLVRQVITLGSPFTGHVRANNAVRLYEWLSGNRVEEAEGNHPGRTRTTPPVPTTSIYSKLDGVVAWRCAIEPSLTGAENIHLRGVSHLGMAASPAALYLLANRLAQPEGHWKPFRPTPWQRLLYGVHDHHQRPTRANPNLTGETP